MIFTKIVAMNRLRPMVYDMTVRMGNGFRPHGFAAGELVKIDDENEDKIFIVIKEYFDEVVMSPRLQVISANGKVRAYPLAWFTEIC
jgi:hypothetical protein